LAFCRAIRTRCKPLQIPPAHCAIAWGAGTLARQPQHLQIRRYREEDKEGLPVSTHTPPVTGSDAENDRARGRSLHEREGEEMARAADAMRAAAARLPPNSQIGRELAAWASRMAFAAEIHKLVGPAEDEEPRGG
jgi:hypothetical protein